MERLTEKVLGFTQLKDCGNDFCKEICVEHDEEKSCNNCPIQKAFEKLAEYEDLEEQKKLLKLPCAVGDMTYYVSNLDRHVIDAIVQRIEIDADGFWVITSAGTHSFDDFGRTVFLIKESAEAAMKEMSE